MYKIPANTLFTGKNLIFVPECHSTNTLALQFCQQKSVADGTVVITNHQTAGRGQRSNTWEAEPGKNLTFSVVFRPGFLAVNEQFYLSVFTALALVDFLAGKTNQDIHIKWPNDILVHGKKICGILIENQIQGTRIQASVIGIGLNINQQQFTIPTATSLQLATGRAFDLNAALDELLQALEQRYLQLSQRKLQLLSEEYHKALFWYGEEHLFEAENNRFTGVITGVDPEGRLLLSVGGEQKVYQVKEIRFIS